MTDNPSESNSGLKSTLITFIAISAIVGASLGIMYLIQATEPEVERDGATRRSAALVEVVELKIGDFRPTISALGTVEPSREIELRPQVSGEIISFSEDFIPGGFVEKGELLLKIDPADYVNQLAMRESDLAQSKADLELEKGQQTAAEQEFALLGEEIDASNRSLILREPQIRIAEARLAASQAMRDTAQLDLDRTQVFAPFDSQIIERSVNMGSQVSSGTNLASLVGIDEYWVIASVPQADLRWIDLPKENTPGAAVEIAKPTVWGPESIREGRVLRLIGTLDESTRLARLLIGISDPLAQKTDGPPLLLGTVVETRIQAKEFKNVAKIDREYLRGENRVWIMKDGELDIRDITIAYLDESYAYVDSGVEDGETLVMTNLATVSQGLKLRLLDETTESE
ncbi:MAG: efflux RND transporter periplasmic adaptor subunit [Opitutales bacterium]